MTTISSSTPLFCLDAVVLDTETTSLDAETASVIQIGAFKVRSGEIVEEEVFDHLVNPGVPIPGTSSVIHGIFDRDVVEAPAFTDLADDLQDFIGDRIVVGHNIAFDLTIFKREYERAGLPWQRPRSLDTQILARIVRASLVDLSLDTVAEWLGVAIRDRHTALGDARATADIFLKLVPCLRQYDIRTLAEAERASRSFSDIHDSHAQAGWIPPVHDGIGEDFGVPALAKIDSFPYRHRVGDIMGKPPLIADRNWPVVKAVEALVEKNVSSVFVAPDGTGDPFGITTERDLMRAIARRDPESHAETLGDIMSAPLRTVREDAFVYQAIGRMRRLGFRHLAVENEEGEIVGALTTGDLLRQRASDAIILGEEIEQAKDVADLGAAWARIPLVARSLVKEGVDARDISAVVSEELCALTRRACQLAEVRLAEKGRGGPPVPYVLLVLGSGGRGETLLAPDQDNAILFESGAAGGPEDKWFAELGTILADILNEVGLPYCNGGVMAKNADWRHSSDDWVAEIKGWIGRADWRDVCNVDIFFDFRAVYGDQRLANALWREAYDIAHRSPGFLKQLAAAATDFRAPLSVFGTIKTEEGRVDLKAGGILPLVSGARVLALRHAISKRATRDRLRGVEGLEVVNAEDLENVIEAHGILLNEDLNQQLEDIAQGTPPSNKVALKRLPKSRREKLRWAFGKVDVMNALVGDPVAFG